MVAYQNEETIDHCVSSLVLLGPNARLAICDNHESGGTIPVAQTSATRLGLPFRSLHRPDNPGFAVACNELASESTAAWLMFLNPDASLQAWPGIGRLPAGLSGARLINSRGHETHNYGFKRTMFDEVARRLQLPRRRPRGHGYVSGAAMVLPTHIFQQVGGFDERFYMYYEDIDLCRRLNEADTKVWLRSDFVVKHIGGHSTASDPERAAVRSYESATAFYGKWRGSSWAFSLVALVDGALRHALSRIGLPIPGGRGAESIVRLAWADVLRSLRAR